MISSREVPANGQSNRQQAVNEPNQSRVVPKPQATSHQQDARTYQVSQLIRRFSATSSSSPNGATSIVFRLVPSDPDFPFELTHLHCDIHVPKDYPKSRPTLSVRNKDLPRGFAINIERGWTTLTEEKKDSTLLGLTNALDRKLEAFLSEQKVETVKIMPFYKDTRHIEHEQTVESAGPVKPSTPPSQAPRYIPEKSYSRDEIAEAKAKRAQEVRQLEARMGRLPAFRKSPDGVVFTLPIEPKRRGELPQGLQSVISLHLIVPLLYPLQSLRIQLNESDAADAEPVEELFTEKASQQRHMTLTSHINYLTQNLHLLAKQASAQAQAREKEARLARQEQLRKHEAENANATITAPPVTLERGHIQVIPRPPEWNLLDGEEDSDESYNSSDDDGGVALDEPGQDEQAVAQVSTDTPERGTMLTFPTVELHGIEILQVSVLGLSVKCERCRTVNDITGLKPDVEKAESCKKCASTMAAKFRQQPVHEYSTRAGFIDVFGCKIADMLPSTFVPTCARCSTTCTGIVSVRGEVTTNVCRECHAKFTFKLPDVRFLLITPGSLPPPASAPRRKQDKLGLHAGEPLPSRGACSHYRKSYRWFRFSCCGRVHPCDRCHEEAEDHVNEWANRMICGWCSREQNYAVDACGFCGRSVIGRKGRGFWEGGKGTRDQRMMSRKDPRKYKRIGGGPTTQKE